VTNSLPALPNRFILVSSGVPQYSSSRRLGFIGAFRRSVTVVHQANGRARQEQALAFLKSSPGVIVGIGDNPYEIAAEAADQRPDRADMVLALLARMESTERTLTRAWWAAVAQEWNPTVKTDLRPLGADNATRLVLHGYVAAAARCTTQFGWAAPDQPPTLGILHELAVSPPPKKPKKSTTPVAIAEGSLEPSS
jgi:hypothetical protein